MSFSEHAILWLHITAAVFAIGPGTAAIMSTPRYIKKQNTVVVGYLYRTTRIYSVAALLTLVFGLISAGQLGKFSEWWISASMTLFIIAFLLLLLVMRDQRTALRALAEVKTAAVPTGSAATRSDDPAEQAGDAGPADTDQPAATAAVDLKIAAVERGRIAALSGITALIWLAILVLMVFNAS